MRSTTPSAHQLWWNVPQPAPVLGLVVVVVADEVGEAVVGWRRVGVVESARRDRHVVGTVAAS